MPRFQPERGGGAVSGHQGRMTTAGRMTLAARQLEIPTETSRQNRSRIGSLRDSIGTLLWGSFEGARSPGGRISRTLGRIGTRRDRNLLLEPARRICFAVEIRFFGDSVGR